ncbi:MULTISPECIES: hypothetical protein [Rhizobium/Agrobacterium group]|uniref:hypothetical protein n=1 Tax=Rhizobium/Agrobacterium group TaxID=227290 RepID=UPI00056F3321|nr:MULTISPECIES: hypothetical protein [Rhizobium/Agrobacterium group]AKC10636.1 hypothetical protein Ach5_48730 [Agrobacterium tumefaciens]AYM20019.1 hypothetical protein At15955_50340 [Agrobacterium tumefaciens]AYM71322.1 hypothetical protein AtA6_51060 [Agrobacterium tumefaciens]NIB59711.1 hypothetical protein [Agrobacterium tumefaciens]NSZ25136.1 hypothetical protein [Agrobacterium tumefaciens]
MLAHPRSVVRELSVEALTHCQRPAISEATRRWGGTETAEKSVVTDICLDTPGEGATHEQRTKFTATRIGNDRVRRGRSRFRGITPRQADAQEAQPAKSDTTSNQGTIELEPIDVRGAQEKPNTLQPATGIDRLPGKVQGIPQTVAVIPQTINHEHLATTVSQVTQYVPAIRLATGEGNGGMNGDQFRILRYVLSEETLSPWSSINKIKQSLVVDARQCKHP